MLAAILGRMRAGGSARWTTTAVREAGPALTWALVETRPNSELSVGRRFIRQSFHHHLFLHEVSRVRGGRRINYLRPAFPRYIFIEADDIWRRVLDTEGVLRFLPDHLKRPYVIDPIVIDGMLVRAPNHIWPYQQHARFLFGDRVRFTPDSANPLYGHEGIYQYAPAPGRACILVPWLGALRPTELGEDSIEKVFAMPLGERRRRGRRGGRKHRNGSLVAQSVGHAAAGDALTSH